MIRLFVLAMFIINPLFTEEPTPEIDPVIEITEDPTEEAPVIPVEISPEFTPATDKPILEIITMPSIEEQILESYEIPTISGCTDKRAINYIPSDNNWKVVDDGSCFYLEGCTDPKAANYIDFGMYTKDDGSCYYFEGCTDPDAVNYVDFGIYTKDDGSCYYLICNDETGCEVSYTNPRKQKQVNKPEDNTPESVYSQDKMEESPELTYIFDLDNTPYFNEIASQEVCEF